MDTRSWVSALPCGGTVTGAPSGATVTASAEQLGSGTPAPSRGWPTLADSADTSIGSSPGLVSRTQRDSVAPGRRLVGCPGVSVTVNSSAACASPDPPPVADPAVSVVGPRPLAEVLPAPSSQTKGTSAGGTSSEAVSTPLQTAMAARASVVRRIRDIERSSPLTGTAAPAPLSRVLQWLPRTPTAPRGRAVANSVDSATIVRRAGDLKLGGYLPLRVEPEPCYATISVPALITRTAAPVRLGPTRTG